MPTGNPFTEALPRLGLRRYSDYWKTGHWLWLVSERAGKDKQCYVCGFIPVNTQRLTLHHISYANLGAEKPEDTIPVCTSCHQGIHKALDAKYPGMPVYYKAERTLWVCDLEARRVLWVTPVSAHQHAAVRPRKIKARGTAGSRQRRREKKKDRRKRLQGKCKCGSTSFRDSLNVTGGTAQATRRCVQCGLRIGYIKLARAELNEVDALIASNVKAAQKLKTKGLRHGRKV